MSKRSKSRNEQRKPSGKEQKPKVAASEAAAPVKPDEAPIARAPQTPAPQKPASTTPASRTPAPQTSSAAPKPPRAAPTPATSPEPRPYVLNHAVDTMERSLKAAGQGTLAVNRKLIDFAQANVSSSLDLAKSLACARTPMQVMHLQVTFWDERMKALASQAEELRALSAEIVAKANEPIREHMRRSLGDHAG